MTFDGASNTEEKKSPEVTSKQMFLNISQHSQEYSLILMFLIKLLTEACSFIKKETQAQVLSCEFCKIFKNTCFYRTPPVATSDWKITPTIMFTCQGNYWSNFQSHIDSLDSQKLELYHLDFNFFVNKFWLKFKIVHLTQNQNI